VSRADRAVRLKSEIVTRSRAPTGPVLDQAGEHATVRGNGEGRRHDQHVVTVGEVTTLRHVDKTTDFADGDDRFHVIIDIGGNATLRRLRFVLTPKGTLVITGGEGDGRWLGGADRQIRAQVVSLFVGQKLGTFIASVNGEDLIALKEMIENGKLAPVVDRTYQLSEVSEAIVYLDEGHARGKVAINV
jgi:NADPH:quinone reductase-like Zn-dependent oxidoreductase